MNDDDEIYAMKVKYKPVNGIMNGTKNKSSLAITEHEQ
jgi:hypothetical protein